MVYSLDAGSIVFFFGSVLLAIPNGNSVFFNICCVSWCWSSRTLWMYSSNAQTAFTPSSLVGFLAMFRRMLSCFLPNLPVDLFLISFACWTPSGSSSISITGSSFDDSWTMWMAIGNLKFPLTAMFSTSARWRKFFSALVQLVLHRTVIFGLRLTYTGNLLPFIFFLHQSRSCFVGFCYSLLGAEFFFSLVILSAVLVTPKLVISSDLVSWWSSVLLIGQLCRFETQYTHPD